MKKLAMFVINGDPLRFIHELLNGAGPTLETGFAIIGF